MFCSYMTVASGIAHRPLLRHKHTHRYKQMCKCIRTDADKCELIEPEGCKITLPLMTLPFCANLTMSFPCV